MDPVLSGAHLVVLGSNISEGLEAHLCQEKCIREKGEEHEADVGENPHLKGGEAVTLVWSVVDHWVENDDYHCHYNQHHQHHYQKHYHDHLY